MEAFIGIDLGGTNVRAGAFDRQGKLLAVREAPIEASRGPQLGLQRIIQLVEQALRECATPGGAGGAATPVAIGIGSTGPLDRERGTINNPYTLPTWEDVPIVGPLQAHFSAPVVLENDADSAALGEYWQGAGQGAQRLYAVTVGTGIGAALVYQGQVYRGLDGTHPDGGHLPLDPCGPLCYCGLHGCWEVLACGPAIARRMAEHLAAHPQADLPAGQALDARQVAGLALAGQPAARQVMAEVAEDFSRGLAAIVLLFTPEVIVLSGGVMRSLSLFLPAIQRRMEQIDIMVPARRIRVLPAALGENAGLYGAAYAAILAAGARAAPHTH